MQRGRTYIAGPTIGRLFLLVLLLAGYGVPYMPFRPGTPPTNQIKVGYLIK